MRYEFYPDVFWITNFAMDLLVLLLVRRIRKHHGPLHRLFLAAVLGAAASVLFVLWLPGLLWYRLLIHILVNPAMLFLVFRQRNVLDFLKDFFWSYGVTILLGGVMSFGLQRADAWQYFPLWALFAYGVSTLIFYGFMAQKERKLCFELLVMTEQERLSLTGFLDTGNLLTDPIMHQPVHIIQEELLLDAITKEGLPIRYIPFHSLGQEQGLLPVVTLKAMYIRRPEDKESTLPAYIEKPVFGLAKEKLFQQKKYQVILNAGCNSI